VRRGNQDTRLCCTCWLPGHFSEECPVVPEHLRPEIAARKHKALTELRRQRAELQQIRRPGWYRSRAEPPASRDLPTSPLTTTEPTPTLMVSGFQGEKQLHPISDPSKSDGWRGLYSLSVYGRSERKEGFLR
jgi:hypothetical protein